MKNISVLLLFCVLSFVVICFGAEETGKKTYKAGIPVEVSLNSNWNNTPMLLEGFEAISDIDPHDKKLFWDVIDTVGDVEKLDTAKQQYDALIEAAKTVLTKHMSDPSFVDTHIALLKLQLAYRTHSAAVAVHEALGRGVVSPGVDDMVLLLDGKSYKTREEMEAVLKTRPDDSHYDSRELVVDQVDHFCDACTVKSQDNMTELTRLAILYAHAGTASFVKVNALLKEACKAHVIDGYVLRHFWHSKSIKNPNNFIGSTPDIEKTPLPGFGVEFALKSVEYKVIDEADNKQAEKKTEEKEEKKAEDDDSTEQLLSEEYPYKLGNNFDTLTRQALDDLKAKVSKLIIQSKNPMETLRVVSQNFPILAEYISENVKLIPRGEAGSSEEESLIGYGTARNGIIINGRTVEKDHYDMYSLLDIIENELKTVELLEEAHVTRSGARMLIQNGFSAKDSEIVDQAVTLRYNIQNEGILFMNDLESTDRNEKYSTWKRTFNAYDMRYTYNPRHLGRNIETAVILVDPLDHNCDDFMNGILFYVIRQSFPIRVGVAFRVTGVEKKCDWLGICSYDGSNSPSLMFARAFCYIMEHYGWRKAGVFFWYAGHLFPESPDKVTVDNVRHALKNHFSQSGIPDDADIIWQRLVTETKYDQRIMAGAQFVDSFEIEEYPQSFVNGVPVGHSLNPVEVLREAVNQFDFDIIKRLKNGQLNDETKDIYKTILDPETNPDVLPEYSSMAFPSKKHPARYTDFLQHSSALDALRTAQYEPTEGKHRDSAKLLTTLICTSGGFDEKNNEDVKSAVKLFVDYASEHGDDIRVALFDSAKYSSDAQQRFCQDLAKTLDVEDPRGLLLVTINGRSYAINASKVKSKDIVSINRALLKEATAVARIVDRTSFNTSGSDVDPDSFDNSFVSDLRTRLHSYMMWETHSGRKKVERTIHNDLPSFVIGNEDEASVLIWYNVNPLSTFAQRMTPRLQALVEAGLPIAIRVEHVYDPWEIVKDTNSIPLKTFYTELSLSQPTFDDKGSLYTKKTVMERLPDSRLITLGMVVPFRWLVMAHEAEEDLDNIRLDAVAGNGKTAVKAEYLLENLMVEGSCDAYGSEDAPPNGLELELVPRKSINGATPSDTLVMTILGYFQLKAAPGVWSLRIREGRSDDLYVVLPDGKPYDDTNDEVVKTMGIQSFSKPVVLRKMIGEFVSLQVQKRPGLENIGLLEDKEVPSVKQKREAENVDSWAKLESLNLEEHVNEDDGKVHIFSVASGHLYERFVKIMVLSVVRRSSVPCKFWFIENYLSPKFKRTIGLLADAYHFEYEFVTYKWPVWLHEQTEKQRLIWGYKILFLDVIFPISLHKVIYVDADQVVRTDMKILMDMNLHHAALGMTPFCSGDIMNNATADFRFWDTGFWKDHLQGRPYHISALFVVDLKRFRALGAGDTYRRVYNSLSNDPDSLANLDQDLPNYLQFDVPMYSLDKHWLWCESWCSNESKSEARTIDLCNNPLTKRPKLDAAKLFIEEWTELDNDIHATEERALELQKEKEHK